MAMVNPVHKQMVKAASAILATRDTVNAGYIGVSLSDVALQMGLQLGGMSSAEAIARNALGVHSRGERASNRMWGEYPAEVKTLASRAAIELVKAFGMALPSLESHRRHVPHEIRQVRVAQHLPHRVSLPDVEPVVVGVAQ